MSVQFKLRNILTFNFVLVALLPIMLIGVITLYILTDSLEKEITDKNLLLAKALAGEVERFLQEPLSLLGQVKEVVESGSLVDEDRINDYLEAVIRHYSFFERIQVLDEQMVVVKVAPFLQEQLGLSLLGHPFIKSAIKLNQPYWSPTFVSMETGKPTIALSRPFINGMVVGYLNLASLEAMASRLVVGSSGYAIMADQNGIIIAHPKKKVVSERWNLKNLLVVRQGLAGREGTYRDNLDNESIIGSVAVAPQTGWLVIVIQPVKEAFAPVDRIRNIFSTGAALATVLALLMAVTSLKKTLSPLARLIASAKDISRGNYEFRPQPESYPEIDELSRNFERMILAVKNREEALRFSEERYRALVENLPVGLYRASVGPQAEFIMANSALARMFGYGSVDELLRSRLEDFYQNSTESQEFYEVLSTRGEVVSRKFKLKRKDGGLFWGAATARVVEEPGQEAFIDGMIEDITGLVRADEERRQLEAQVIQAQKMEAVGTLASGIAHDFNNILQVISGYVQLLMNKMDNHEPELKYLKDMDLAVERASDLIHRLLAFSRKVEPELKPVNLNQEIINTVRILERTIPRMIRIITRLSENLKTIKGDSIQLERLLVNLATNARDAMPEGGELTLMTDNVDFTGAGLESQFGIGPGEFILLRVADTGQGIARETAKRIYEPFFTTKEIGKGTGLGMSTVYGIVKKHGGHIFFDSEPGRGTTFNIYFPALKKYCPLDVPLDEKPAKETVTGHETILLVDDEIAILEVARDILEEKGYKILIAKSGEEALNIFIKNPGLIDLVILDLGMPGMGGHGCLKELIKIDPRIKVLIASGYSVDDKVQKDIRELARGFIGKPYRLIGLLNKVREILEG